MIIVGIDTGGTFTDFIYNKNGQWGVYKLLSTPQNPAQALISGLSNILDQEKVQVVHGSTVATNAILENKGVKTAVITNSGFEDLLQIGRQNRHEIYNLFYRKPPSIVPKDLCLGVSCRISQDGDELEPLDLEQVWQVCQKLKNKNVKAAAVCFLFSYLNPKHENLMQKMLQDLDINVSKSHAILREFREFERLSTTVVNAYVSLKMSKYLQEVKDYILDNPLRIMQSNGGSISVQTAMQEPVRTILSGPAGGVVGAQEIGKAAGLSRLITFDMGGTSTDVCLMDNQIPLSLESSISGYPLRVPMLDIHTVGAGGGSIAFIDAGGSLKVGPESSGADPGPVCYGRGEDITVTDANLFLGRLIPEQFLGGGMTLQTKKLNQSMKNMAESIGLCPEKLAEGILNIANTNMERAIRVISVQRGFDPREFTLLAFGGAGGMHCAFLARLLSIPQVLIPKNPGILSAMGMVMADVIRDYSRTVMVPGQETDYSILNQMFKPLKEQAMQDLLFEGFTKSHVVLETYLDMRYQGQSFEIIVPFDQDYEQGFTNLHAQKYGYQNPSKPLEIVNLRIRARGRPQKPAFGKSKYLYKDVPDKALLGTKEVIFESRPWVTKILDRQELIAGNEFIGPAVVVEYTSTIVVPPFASAEVDEYSNLVLKI